MNTEPELLNERLERLAMVLDEIMPNCALLVRDALELLKEQDAVVRCKDCIHMKDDGSISPLIWCSIHEFGRMNDYFCADGERK